MVAASCGDVNYFEGHKIPILTLVGFEIIVTALFRKLLNSPEPLPQSKLAQFSYPRKANLYF